MLPLSDGVPARRFPFVNVSLIVACFGVWLFYELPNLNGAIYHASFYPCTVDDACRGPEPWGVSWITAMFMHESWERRSVLRPRRRVHLRRAGGMDPHQNRAAHAPGDIRRYANGKGQGYP